MRFFIIGVIAISLIVLAYVYYTDDLPQTTATGTSVVETE